MVSHVPPPSGASGPDAALSWLWGSRVQRIDSPEPGLFALTLYHQGQKRTLLLSVHPQRLGVGCVEQRPVGKPATGFVRRLRVAADNATLASAHWLGITQSGSASAIELRLTRKDSLTRLAADFHAQQPNLLLLNERGQIVGAAEERSRRARFPDVAAPYAPSPFGKVPRVDSPEQCAADGVRLLADKLKHADGTRREMARAQAKTSLKRVMRRIAAVEGDLARAQNAPSLRREANLLLCHLQTVPTGANVIELLDEAVEPAQPVVVTLDPSLSAQRNAEQKFTRARRLERGLHIAEERLAAARAEAAQITAFLASLDTAPNETLDASAKRLGLRIAEPASAPHERTRGAPAHVAYRVFEATSGHRILVGKGAVDNDTLTLTVARPHDLWLHVRGVHGAHVVILREKHEQLPPETLLDGAHLAAHFSDVRGEPSAEIQHTDRRYLRKPKGSPPGAVRVDREKVLLLRVEADRLRRLLASERTS